MTLTSADLLEDPVARYPAATVACFDPTRGELPRRALDEWTHAEYLKRLAAAGAEAVLIAASTGQGHLRAPEELEQWFRAAAEVDLGRTVKVALLRPEDGLEVNCHLLGLLKSWGYQIVFVRPGTDLPPDASDRQIAENLRPILREGARLGLALGLYSIPDVSGVRLTAEAAASLVAGPGGDHVVAVKVTEACYETSTRQFLAHPELSRLKIVQGWDPHLAQALREGPEFDAAGRQRCGVTSGPMAFAIHQYTHILAAARQNDWEEVATAQAAVTALFQSMQDDPAKFADLQRAKAIMGLGQPLIGTVTDDQVKRVFAALERLPRGEDRARLARSLDLMERGPYHDRLAAMH